MDSTQNNNYKLFSNDSIGCNLDFKEIQAELLSLFKSPNPLLIYQNSQVIKQNFANFLNCLSTKISAGFDIGDNPKNFIFSIYKQSNYHKVWIGELESYLRDSKNFDLLSYLFFVKTLNKDKQCIFIGLQKLYNKDSDENIIKFLSRFKLGVGLKTIKKLYNDFNLANIKIGYIPNENFCEQFIERIYLNLPIEKRNLFLDNFILRIDKNKLDFSDCVKVLQKVINSYVTVDKREMHDRIVNSLNFEEIKISIDELILNYPSFRNDFYVDVNYALSSLNKSDRYSFWLYTKTKIIDNYYKEVKYLFYDFSSNIFLDKDSYTRLKGNIKIQESISPEGQFLQSELQEILTLKNLILELNNNLFSFFLLPIIYYTISENLAIPKKDLYKMKYLLLYIFSNNYGEYKNIYMFFNQLEIFLNYDKKPRVLEKIQVSFSIFLSVFLFLGLSYLSLPIGVFLGILLYSLVKYIEVIHPNAYYRQKWNIGIKFFAIVFLSISTYFWFQNFDQVKIQTKDLTSKVQYLGSIPTKDVLDKGYYYLKASILDAKKH